MNYIFSLDSNEVEIRLLDMQPSDSKIIILAAAINVSHTPQIYYALITMAENASSSYVLSSYYQIKHNSFYTGNVSADNLKMKFILNRNVAYVFDDKIVYQIYFNGKRVLKFFGNKY